MMTAADKVAVADTTSEKLEKHADKRKALGRGLESLLPSRDGRAGWSASPVVPKAAGSEGAGEMPAAPTSSAPHSVVIGDLHAQAAGPEGREAIIHIPLDQIDPNPYQTRVQFDEEALTELRESIRTTGVVQPIVVRPGQDGRYVLVLGERRCRASKAAGKTTIPAVVRRVSDQQAAEMTIVENLHRQDLNCMEQAAAFSKLSKEFKLTQAEIGEKFGISRESVGNYLRLLRLPGTVMQYFTNRALGFSEARELLKLESNQEIESVAKKVVEEQLSFIQLTDMVEKLTMLKYVNQEPPKRRGARWIDPNVRAAAQELQRVLGLQVKISDRDGKGKIVIEYSTVDDYERVVGMLRGK